jgi:DUF971 family protein
MSQRAPDPTEVEVKTGERIVRIAWDDGRESRFAFAFLRGHCPCAVCQGHGTERRFVQVDVPMVARIEEVGSYALNIVWKDADAQPLHSTGLYAYDFLLQLDREQRSPA